MELALDLAPACPHCARNGNDAACGRAEPTDGDLIQRVADGDRDAFGDLYQRYARPVFGLALRRLGDRGRAEDAVQETFASVWRSARTTGPSAARARLALRGRAERDRRPGPRAAREPPAEPADAPSDEAGPRAKRRAVDWVAWRVHRALEELPETERTVLELAYWGGLSQSEIADFLGIPLGTVKTRTRSGARPAGRPARREELRMSDAARFPRAGRRGRPAEERRAPRRAHDMLIARRPAARAPAGARRRADAVGARHDAVAFSPPRPLRPLLRSPPRSRSPRFGVGYLRRQRTERLPDEPVAVDARRRDGRASAGDADARSVGRRTTGRQLADGADRHGPRPAAQGRLVQLYLTKTASRSPRAARSTSHERRRRSG